MKKINLKVFGMVCNGCENRIKNALLNIEGVSKVNANHNKNLVTIVLKDEVDQNILIDEIKKLGFEVEED